MGISKSALKLLMQEGAKRSFKGKSILQLGRQHTFLTFETITKVAKQTNFPLSEVDAIRFSFDTHLAASNFIDDITLFTLLGFSTIHSLDVSSYEAASIVHDLNMPISSESYNQYDVIFDGGTLEHVFNVPQVFNNIHNLLKENGIIIHASPSHNHVDHGFYMFSPTLFSDYYSENSYKILTSYVFEYGFENNTNWKVFEYKPGCLEHLSFGGFGRKMLGIWFVAEKQSCSTCGVIPQQGACSKELAIKEVSSEFSPSRLRNLLKKSDFLRFLVTRARKKIRQFTSRRLLKKIGSF